MTDSTKYATDTDTEGQTYSGWTLTFVRKGLASSTVHAEAMLDGLIDDGTFVVTSIDADTGDRGAAGIGALAGLAGIVATAYTVAPIAGRIADALATVMA